MIMMGTLKCLLLYTYHVGLSVVHLHMLYTNIHLHASSSAEQYFQIKHIHASPTPLYGSIPDHR